MSTRQRKPSPDDIVTRGGLTRREVEQGYISATPEQNKAWALSVLRQSAEREHDALIFDDPIDVEALANTAGVLVQYVRVDLATGTLEHRTADGRQVQL